MTEDEAQRAGRLAEELHALRGLQHETGANECLVSVEWSGYRCRLRGILVIDAINGRIKEVAEHLKRLGVEVD